MKRCANCELELSRRSEPIIVASEHVAGVRSGVWVILHFCSAGCIFAGGRAFDEAVTTGHAVAYGPDQIDIYETADAAGAAANECLRAPAVREMRAQLQFLCPFCERVCSANASEENGILGVTHTLPTCAQFDDLEPTDFLKATRQRFSN